VSHGVIKLLSLVFTPLPVYCLFDGSFRQKFIFSPFLSY
jgi:hypothetical protein